LRFLNRREQVGLVPGVKLDRVAVTTAEQPPATTAKPTPPPTAAEPQASAPEGQGNEGKAGESPLEAAPDQAVTPPPDATPAAPRGQEEAPTEHPSEPPSSSNLILDKQLLTTRIKEALAGEDQHSIPLAPRGVKSDRFEEAAPEHAMPPPSNQDSPKGQEQLRPTPTTMPFLSRRPRRAPSASRSRRLVVCQSSIDGFEIANLPYFKRNLAFWTHQSKIDGTLVHPG
jgi:hypothetical protein